MGHQEFQERRPRVDLKRMKILDVVLIASILLGSTGWLLASRTDSDLGHLDRREVVVYHDGVVTARMGLDSDNTVALLEGKIILEILDHRLRIKHSDCPRQFCVHQGWVQYEGESIVCVPYKTLIDIQSSAKPVMDAVVY